MKDKQKITREDISRMIDEKFGIKHSKNIKNKKDKTRNDRINKTTNNGR